MKTLRDIFWISLVSAVVLLCIDIVAGAQILGRVTGSAEKEYRILHPVYHHTLQRNVETEKALWGDRYYQLCTDDFGFKRSCNSKVSDARSADLAIIGDSFTEGIGMPYEKSFVGLISEGLPQMTIVNLGVASYSPKIYLSKIKYLLGNGFRFKHILVFVDISDVMDDSTAYIYHEGRVYDTIGRDSDQIDRTDTITSEVKAKLLNLFPLSYEILKTAKNLLSGRRLQDMFVEGGGLGRGYQSQEIFRLAKSAWTYDQENPNYGPHGVEGAVKESVSYMEQLYELLHAQGIELSVGVYPWPAQLANDTVDSRHVKTWSEFCIAKCVHFINLYPFFFKELARHGIKKTYERFYIPGDLHFNELGNAAVGDVVLEMFAR